MNWITYEASEKEKENGTVTVTICRLGGNKKMELLLSNISSLGVCIPVKHGQMEQ